jgi:hypothetical protein
MRSASGATFWRTLSLVFFAGGGERGAPLITGLATVFSNSRFVPVGGVFGRSTCWAAEEAVGGVDEALPSFVVVVDPFPRRTPGEKKLCAAPFGVPLAIPLPFCSSTCFSQPLSMCWLIRDSETGLSHSGHGTMTPSRVVKLIGRANTRQMLGNVWGRNATSD